MEKNIITISKKGNFCNIYNNDCYILYYLFNYKIINNKLGFPINSLPKVITTLENRKINYSINNKETLCPSLLGVKNYSQNKPYRNQYQKYCYKHYLN